MGIDEYLIEEEKIKDTVETKETGEIDETLWDWYVTSERVIKHGSGRYFGREEFHDVSLDKVTGVSFESGRQNWLLGLGILVVFVGLVLPRLPQEIVGVVGILEAAHDAGMGVTVGGVVVGILFIFVWYFSTQPYLYIRSLDQSEKLKMEVSGSYSSTSSEEVREFIKSLRRELR